MTSRAEADRIGQVIGGKYRVVRLLARGGMAVVYEAQHTLVHRRFAIKLLRPDLAQRRDILARFEREAATAGALENENVAAAVDFGITEDGTPYIVMEFLAGESLGALLEREGRLPLPRAADLIAQACRGVGAAHAAGIVHRDLKPHNLFVCRREDGTDLVKVLDFGVAKLQAIDAESAATHTGTTLGTAAYMSPEQARGERTIDARTDIYALGAILYELLSQQRPHPGESQNAILHHIATYPAVALESVAPDLAPEVVAIVTRALASDPADRQASAEQLGRELAPFARREVWPAPAVADPARPRAPATPALGRTPAPARRPGRGRTGLVAVGLVGAALAAALVLSAGRRRHTAPPTGPAAAARAHRSHGFDPATRFLGSDPPSGAVAQIETLIKSNRVREAALVSAMVGTPSAIWFLGGSPEQVRVDVSDAVVRGGRQGRLPVLVAYNHPFRDCTGYGLIGAADAAAYQAWIDGFASGIGNERVIVILEPSGLGLIPYASRLDGPEDKCHPTRAGADGQRVPAPGATAEQRYAQLNYAVDALAARAPRAAVYLDGTHSAWLPVGDIAYRLARAGVDRTAGFFLNAGNYQPTRRQVQYGTWIAKCLRHAARSAAGPSAPQPYRECAAQSDWMNPDDDAAWAKIDDWYAQHFDGPDGRAGAPELTHFVINTNRNGRGPLDVSVYARPPFNQPPPVIETLRNGSWCMPPGRGLGLRPTAATGVPLVDAYLWTDTPGTSVAACDVAGGARAWDYGRYNPWALTDDAQNHFDPLWGRVLPSAGEWFPDGALELARNAAPALGLDEPTLPEQAALLIPPRAAGPAASAGRPAGHPAPHGRPDGHPATAPADPAAPVASPNQPSFDPNNPYR